MVTRESEIPGSLTIIPLGYRTRCTEARCKNLARMILRYADAGGRPMSNSEFCHAHARVRVSRDQAAGLKVYNDREVRASTGK
jgi:hypothetical protein